MSITKWKSGTLYLPGEIVTPKTLPPNVITPITNGDFESGDVDWTKSTNVSILSDAARSFNGSWFMEFIGDLSVTSGNAQNDIFVPVVAGQNIKLKAMYDLGSDLSATCQLQFLWYTANNSGAFLSSIDSPEETTVGNEGWKEISFSAIAPNTALFVQIALIANTDWGTVLFDNSSWDLAYPGSTDGLVFKATQAESGLSGTDEPAWPTVVGATVVDNEITWEAVAASTVTWQAASILKSGSTEPTWPLVAGSVVSDGNISWETVRLHIDDPNCPQTREVAIGASKIFAGDGDITKFSATLNPRDWSSEFDAGFLPSGLHQGEEIGVSAIGMYRGNLAIWSPSGVQIWQIDPDPTAMALLDTIEGIGSMHQKAVNPVSDDLFFLAQLGIRTVGVAVGSTNLAAGDAGIPIDTLVQDEVDSTVDPTSTYYPSAGQYWLAFPPYTESIPLPTLPPGIDPPGGPIKPIITPTSGEGYALTQENWFGTDPDFPSPFANEVWSNITLSAVFKPKDEVAGYLFNIMASGGIDLFVTERPITFQEYFAFKIDTVLPSSSTIAQGTHELTIDHPTWGFDDWYWMAVSYSQTLNECKFSIVNFTKGEEATKILTVENNVDVSWGPSLTSQSQIAWGMQGSVNGIDPLIPFQGPMSQVMIHDDYIDLSIVGNRRKFCCLTGVIPMDGISNNPFGVPLDVFLPRGFPEGNEGTRFIGNPSDFYMQDQIYIDNTIPPVCDGYDFVYPIIQPPEIALPYWDNLTNNGWIDLSKTTITTFLNTFGLPVEGDDFTAIKSIGGPTTPIASLVNTIEGGNKIQIQNSVDATDGIILVVNPDGLVISSSLYNSAGDSPFIQIPTGSDYYLVTMSDTGNALVNKTNSSVINLAGSTPFIDVFGADFGQNPFETRNLIIPAGGIFVAFTVPVTTDVVTVSFATEEMIGGTTPRVGAVNRRVGDFDTPPRHVWGLGGGISGGINNPGKQIDLVPGQTYIFNAKNSNPIVSNWIRLDIFYLVQ